METIVIITSLRELFALYRWVLIRVAKDPKKAAQIVRLVIYSSKRNRKHRKAAKQH
ncbi:hypothetical protein GCM10023093_26100 [Nemorincola caseinilytica]|uniref:Uncharacterized protein n=1 Tax=Nemorincola caseinilytica TaxID=2054315 RepID=A0ABP8NNV0_9BACT